MLAVSKDDKASHMAQELANALGMYKGAVGSSNVAAGRTLEQVCVCVGGGGGGGGC
jgi:hypothetical protein